MRPYIFVSILAGTASFLFVSFRNDLPLARTAPRPVIRVEAVDPVPKHLPAVWVINDFETEKDRFNCFIEYETPGGVRSSLSGNRAAHGSSSLLVVWREKKWGQLVITHFPRDWRGYAALAFDVYNPGAPFMMEIRVGDWYHRYTHDPNLSRFVLRRTVSSGSNEIRILLEDISRRIRPNAARRIIHFSIEDRKQPRTFYLDHVRLER